MSRQVGSLKYGGMRLTGVYFAVTGQSGAVHEISASRMCGPGCEGGPWCLVAPPARTQEHLQRCLQIDDCLPSLDEIHPWPPARPSICLLTSIFPVPRAAATLALMAEKRPPTSATDSIFASCTAGDTLNRERSSGLTVSRDVATEAASHSSVGQPAEPTPSNDGNMQFNFCAHPATMVARGNGSDAPGKAVAAAWGSCT